MKLHKIVKVELTKRERQRILANVRNINEAISEEAFIESIEKLINEALHEYSQGEAKWKIQIMISKTS